MNFKAHLISGVVVSCGLSVAGLMLDYEPIVSNIKTIVPAVILGSLFPDTDCESVPSRWYAIMLAVLFPFAFHHEMLWQWGLLLAVFLAAKIFVHRSWTHSKWLVAALVFSSGIVGLISHWIPSDLLYIKDLIKDFEMQIIFFGLGIAGHVIFDHKLFKRFGR